MRHFLLILILKASLWSDLTLQDCFDLALEYNPRQLSSFYNVQAAQEEALIKKAPYYPEVYGEANVYRWQIHNFLQFPVPPPLPANVVPELVGPTWDFGYVVTGKYTLFDFGDARARYLAAEANVKAACYERERIKEEILLNVAFTFFQLASSNALLEVASKNLERTNKHLDLVKDRREVGSAPLADLLRAKVDVAEARLTLVRSEAQVDISKAKLREALGLDPGCALEIRAIASKHELPRACLLPKARETAYCNRPELMASSKRILALCHKLGAAKSANYPRVTALGAWGQRDQEFWPRDQEFLFGLRFEVPIFTGYRLTHEEGKARSEMNEAKAEYETITLMVDQEISTAYAKLKEAYELIETTIVQVADARESMRLTEERYGAGVSTLTDLLDAQTSLLRAEATAVNADWNFESAWVYFLWTQGLLSQS